LRNITPGFTTVGKGVADTLVVSSVAGLSVGDVFKVNTAGGDAVPDTNVIITAINTGTLTLTIRELDGTTVTPNSTNANAEVAAGDAVFLAQATLFIPAITDIRITEGSSTTFIVTGDTSGTLTTADQVNIRLDSANDVWWWDEAAGTDPINTARVSEFPVQWALRY
jgi:hypothetical protein